MKSIQHLIFLSSLPYLYAYKIDESCSGTDADLMRTAAEQAFDMASQAYDALTMTGARDSNVDRLIELLFSANGQSAANTDVSAVVGSFLGIRQMRNENPDVGNNPDEVVFYCNMDRLEERENGWYDTVSGVALDDPPSHELSECRANSDFTLAYTWTPWDGRVSNGPGQITICPWFLQFSRKLRYKTWKDMSLKYIGAIFAVPLSGIWPFDPIDNLNLLDKVLLHELTHTIAGGQTDDVDWDSNAFGVAYGWKSCKELADSGSGDATINADSLALFGSGIRLLNQDPPSYITDSGRVSKSNPSAKRDVPSYFQHPRTPVASPAFEGFITMIKERRAMATAFVS